MRRIFSVGYLLIALPVVAAAQQRGAASPIMVAPMVRSSAVVVAAPAMHLAPAHPNAPGHVAMRPTGITARPATPHTNVRVARPSAVQKSLRVRPSGGFANAPVADDGPGVPGLGFDYVHYAAVHPNARHSRFNSGFILPFVGGGIYIPVPYYMESEAPAETADNAPAESQEPAAETSEREAAPAAPVRTRSTAIVAPPQLSEFVFVRRDGTVFFAVAYSWSNDKLQYITQDGLRRMAPLDSLDLEATQQFNDQRGVSIRLPA